MKNKILQLLMLLSCSICFSQQEITWEDLSKVTFSDKYFPEFNDYLMQPEFSPAIKALDGQMVTIKGYFLNIGNEEKLYILSKGPMSSCFFCGIGGPETAVELQFSNSQKLKTDDIVSITGILQLNAEDIMHFNYILTDCKATLIN